MSEFACGDVERLKSDGSAMTVVGRVESRSSSTSRRDCDPPGESEIHRLNPLRQKRILEKMVCWRRLEPGSLNLGVDCKTVDELTEIREIIFEPPDEVEYPPGKSQDIPKFRGGYKYYLATATEKGETQEVLVRRAINPIPELIELFSAVNLRKRFQLKDGDEIHVTVFSATCRSSPRGAGQFGLACRS